MPRPPLALVYAAAAAVFLFAVPAQAWPVDVYIDVKQGEEKIERLAALGWAESEDPSVVAVEVLPAGELMLTGKAAGRALVLLYAEGRFAVWRVRVGSPPVEDAEALKKAKGACGGVKHEGRELLARVADERCRLAMRAALESDTFRGRDLELVFDLQAFQGQLRDIELGLKDAGVAGVKVGSYGAGLRLEGKVTRAEHRRALWAVFKRSAGRVPLEDRLELTFAVEETKEP